MEIGEKLDKVKVAVSNRKPFVDDKPCVFDSEKTEKYVMDIIPVSMGRPFILDDEYGAEIIENDGALVAKIYEK